MTPQAFGDLLSLGYFIFAAAVLPMSGWVKSKKHGNMALLGLLGIALGFGALPFGSSIFFLILLYILITFGQLVFYPAIMAIVMGQAAENGGKSGSYMGFYRTVQAVAGIGAPAVGTFIYADAGPSILWIACAVLITLSAIILFSQRMSKATQTTTLRASG